MATRAEINKKYGIVRLMTPDIANEELSAEEAKLYECVIMMQRKAFEDHSCEKHSIKQRKE